MSPAEALCSALDWDWGDPAQRQVCEEAADVVCRIERESCAQIADDAAAAWQGEHWRRVAYAIRDAIRARNETVK